MPSFRSNSEPHLRHERILAETALRRARARSRDARLAAIRLHPARSSHLDLTRRDLADAPALRAAREDIRSLSILEADAAMALGEAETALEECRALHQ